MKSIFTLQSKESGPIIAICGGIHGNEKVGVLALNRLKENLTLLCGTVHIIFGNPVAIERNVRYTESNLNRNFVKQKHAATYEERRALQIMNILDKCDALLDIHAYNEPDLRPAAFAICASSSHKIVKQLPIQTVINGLSEKVPGSTDGYMTQQGKVGIVLEMGSVDNPQSHLEHVMSCITAFLQAYKMIEPTPPSLPVKQSYYQADYVHKRKNASFTFTNKYTSLTPIQAGEVVAYDGNKKVIAKHDGAILFPRPNANIKSEVFWLLKAH